MNNKEIFSSNLRRYMKLNQVARKKLSEDLGVSYYTITDWVNGKKYPRMDKVELLAAYFGILISDLVEDKKEMQKNNDTAVDIVDKLMDNPSIYPLVDRLIEDSEFLSLVKKLNDLDSKKINGVALMLDSFS